MVERIGAYDFAEKEGYIYLSNIFCNGLFKVEVKTGETIFLGCFKEEKLCEKKIHREVFQRDCKIYFCPRRGRNVHIYNLADESMKAIEIRKNDEDFFVIEDVILDKDYACLIPKQERFAIRKLDLNSLKVTEINRKIKFEEETLSKCRKEFPVKRLMDGFHINSRDRVFWKEINGKWYGFWPSEQCLLLYTERMDNIDKIPLIIKNKIMWEKYLQKVRDELLEEPFISEARMGVQEFLMCLKSDKNKFDLESSHVGESIWKSLK